MSDITVTPKLLTDKLAEACNAVGGVEKLGRNKEQNYTYQRATDVAKAFRRELFSRGVVVLPNEHAPEYFDYGKNKSGEPKFEVRIRITFQIMGGGEMIPIDGYGVARDSGDKALWKAKTGAMKYMLRGLGLLPDEADDPEKDGNGEDEDDSPVKEWAKKIDAAADAEQLKQVFGDAYKWAHGKRNQAAQDFFIAKKDERKAQLVAA